MQRVISCMGLEVCSVLGIRYLKLGAVLTGNMDWDMDVDALRRVVFCMLVGADASGDVTPRRVLPIVAIWRTLGSIVVNIPTSA